MESIMKVRANPECRVRRWGSPLCVFYVYRRTLRGVWLRSPACYTRIWQCSQSIRHMYMNVFLFISSVYQAEDEASAELPEGHSLERDIYDAIRANVADTLTAMRNPVPVGPVATLAAAGVSAGEAGGVSANPSANHQPVPPATRPPPPTTKRPDAIEAGEIPEDGEEPSTTQGAGNTNDSSTTTPIGAAGATGNYYNRLDGLIESANSSGVVITATLAEQVAVDEAGEKMLMSEIERFRLRQLQRDK